MKVAVTGAAGYLASVLLPKLDALPEVESILALDVRPLNPALARLAKVRLAEADVRTADFAALLAGEDALIHLAFIVAPIADQSAIFDINVIGSERAFEGAARAGVRQIVYASSIAAYGILPGHELPLRETAPRKDQRDFYYCHTKFAVEEYLDRFERAHPEIAVARLRPGFFLGPGIENPLGRSLKSNVVLSVTGSPPIQYTCDEDVAEAFALALRKRARGAFNVTVEDALSGPEAARILGKRSVALPLAAVSGLARAAGALRLAPPELFTTGWLSAARVPMLATSAKIRSELGWAPRCGTSREALLRFAETTATGRPNAGNALFFGWLTLLSRATGGRLALGDAAHELRGVLATINVELTGAGGGAWRVRIDHGRIFVAPGLAAGADSTVRLGAAVFAKLLAGERSVTSALYTGEVRIEGEGHAGFVFGGIVTLFRQMTKAQGLRGALPRAFAGLVLKLAGSGTGTGAGTGTNERAGAR